MKNLKVLALALVGLMSAGAVNAQEEESNKVEAEVSADVVSSYVWRGGKLDDAAIQPTLGISYKGLSLSAWGSYGLTSSTVSDGEGGTTKELLKELDLTLGYSIGGFNIGVTDYWSTTGSDRYFYYPSYSTNHVFEANIGYDFGPVNFQWYTNFAGNDYHETEDGCCKRSYSSYFELTAPFKLGGLDWEANVGAVPYGANYGYYDANSENFAVTNVSLKACKDLKITDSFSIPLFAQIAANPSTQKAYMVVGLTLEP